MHYKHSRLIVNEPTLVRVEEKITVIILPHLNNNGDTKL